MAEFVEFKEPDGEKVLVNIEHIVKVRPDKEGTYLYFDVTTGNNGSTGFSMLHVAETYAMVKKKLQQ